MDTNKSIPEIVEGIDRLGNVLWPIFALQETLRKLGSLENAQKDGEKTVATLKSEIAEINKQHTAAQAELNAARAKVAAAANEAEKQADAIKQRATVVATQTVASAEARAADIVKTATVDMAQEKDRAVKAAKSIVDMANAKRDDILNNANRLVEEAVKVESAKLVDYRQKEERAFAIKIGAAQAKLDEITAKIAKAKAAAKAMME